MLLKAITCFVCLAEAFAVCENYSPPEGFNPKDLHRLLEKVGSPWGGDHQGKFATFICFHVLRYFVLKALLQNAILKHEIDDKLFANT